MVSSQFNSQNDNLGKNCDLQSRESSIKFSRFVSGSISDLLREVNLDEGVRKGIVTTDDPNTEEVHDLSTSAEVDSLAQQVCNATTNTTTKPADDRIAHNESVYL